MNRRHYVMVVVLGAGLGACSADPEALESVASPIVAGDLVTVDPAGYAFVANGQASGSGTFLSPQWVLTSGHVLAQFDGIFRSSFGDPPRAGAVVGTSTTNEIRGVPYAHPNYWGPLGSAGAEQEGPRDVGFDIGLIRLDTAVDGSAYPNKLYNQLSNDWPGSSLRCFGYGATSLSPPRTAAAAAGASCRPRYFPKPATKATRVASSSHPARSS